MKLLVLTGFVVLAVLSRFLPVPPNFSPIMAIALFSGVYFTEKKLAYLLPMAAMLISDIFLGLHWDMFAVYASFAIIVALGSSMKKIAVSSVVLNSLAGAVIFFIVTNLSVWMTSGMYSYNFAGLLSCYEMAVPFFRNTLASSLIYSAVMFGSYELATRYVPQLAVNRIK